MKTVLASIAILFLLGVFGGIEAISAEDTQNMTPRPGPSPASVPVIEGIEMLKAGDMAPQFVLDDIDGKPFDFQASRSNEKIYLMLFWSIFCEPCKEEMPIIKKIVDEYAAKGLSVIAVNLDGGGQLLENIKMISKKYPFRIFLDKETDEGGFVIADNYGVAGTPTMYLVGKDGRVTFAEVGRTPKDDIVHAIEKALNGK